MAGLEQRHLVPASNIVERAKDALEDEQRRVSLDPASIQAEHAQCAGAGEGSGRHDARKGVVVGRFVERVGSDTMGSMRAVACRRRSGTGRKGVRVSHPKRAGTACYHRASMARGFVYLAQGKHC